MDSQGSARGRFTGGCDCGAVRYEVTGQLRPVVNCGFCGECGASLFFRPNDADRISIAAGTLDGPTGLGSVAHIFTADAGDYYVLDDGLPSWPGSMDGAIQ